MLFSVAHVALAFTVQPRVAFMPRVSASTPPMMMASWSTVDGAGSRASCVSALNDLRDAGDATLWNSFRLAPRSVSLAEVCRTTKLEESVLDPTKTEYTLEDIQNTFIKVIIGCTVGAIAWAVGSDALGLDAGLRFTVTYLFAGIPIGILAIGSTAPGILFLPIEAYKAATASQDEKDLRGQRVCKHEASHLLCAYVLGLPVQEVTADDKGPRVVVYDEESVQQPGVLVQGAQIDALAVVAMSGLMAEADAYGKALGASEDLKLLGQMMARCTPALSPQKQQDTSRYAALTAWTIIKKHGKAFDAITAALGAGKSLGECLRAAEEAEAMQSEADKVAASSQAEVVAKETPQERAARERDEMAARGRF